MNGRTQLLIGLSVVVLGAGVAALAFAGGEARVRGVEDVLASPAKHMHGSYVLVGVPQPQEIPLTGPDGVRLVANPEWTGTTADGGFWGPPGGRLFSQRTVTVTFDGDATQWAYRNETKRLPADDEALSVNYRNWTTTGPRPFAIQAFDDGDGSSPRVWGLYDGLLKDPMQPKPSQFTGRLASALPDGTPVPDGVYLYEVAEYKAGCSSKFLPPEEKAKREAAGDL